MSKTQLLQLGGIGLLIALAFFFIQSQKNSSVPSAVNPQAVSTQLAFPSKSPAKDDSALASAASQQAEPPAISRDPFELPPLLQEVLRQKELAQVKTTPVPVGPIDTHLTPQLRLQGIMWGIAQPKAIINRRIVAVGDTIENATVVAVSKDGVTVSFAGQEYLLKLPTKGGAGAGTQTSTWPNQQYGGQSF